MTFSIRPATVADLPAMMALEKHAATAAHWSAEQCEALFLASHPDRVVLVLEEDSILRGFVFARAVSGEWEIENIAIAGVARRRGMGTRLLGELLDMAEQESGSGILGSPRIQPGGAGPL